MTSTTPSPARTTSLPVDVRDLTVDFGKGPVLDGLDLHVPAGEVHAVLGPSGCGKSTLLRVLAGLTPPTRGTARLGGADGSGSSDIVEGDERVAVVFQQPRLLPWLDLRGNVALGATRRRRHEPGAGSREEVDELLHRVHLDGYGDYRPASVSGGMAQRTALARALLARPGVLLLDEPFAALDALTRLTMQGLVDELVHADGTTVVLVTHDVDEAVRLADHITVLGRAGTGHATYVPVDLPRPRDTTDPEQLAAAARLRSRLLSLVGVSDAGASTSPHHEQGSRTRQEHTR
ncbi:ABC transporter ATP-binding protein [Aquipuribacter sp. SD81]|uniref:ABC transporter ATP-binding protein n=1 Tax=Aquipuribacter sp. SD81 TaxID=3127703 RepID=UPI003017E321